VPEKGQETLNVIIQEFNRLRNGIGQEELERAKTGLKSSLILNSESSSNRASSLGSDFYILGRVRSLDEIKNEIEATSVKSILEFLQNNKFEDFTVVTIGPKELSVE
jgi:predicted Zn-dependent peptidase